MASNPWQVVYFPFDAYRLECQINGIRGAIPERALLFCIRADQKVPGMFWSDALQCNFVYVPASTEELATTVSFDVVTSMSLNCIEVSLQRWGSGAPVIRELAEAITVTAEGVMGEERREYEVSYEWALVGGDRNE